MCLYSIHIKLILIHMILSFTSFVRFQVTLEPAGEA